ncbi:DUF4097 family beta strand repeat-containing protein [Dokdonella sp.]|uniref:DUF4097 family beta strand repeat-containing protein n=1 Tax=Dokdonella sp. TaxID=2291710 RepID=UPI0025C089C6|nr:DUF4097 family beta strand repeat-containing protein [Dokdonella sp.]MBX3689440.1 DUF4097 family beta strand repeat protein [Dokdonella sp.]
MKAIAFPLILPFLFVAGLASAQTQINQTRPVNSDARIDVSNIKGSISVHGWDKDEVAISGTLGARAKGLSIEGDAAHLQIKVEAPGSTSWFSWGADTAMGDTTLELKVPRNAQLKLETVSANVDLSEVNGRSLSVNSVSGKLRLDSGAGELEVDSISGSVEINGKASKTHVETVSGSILSRGLGGEIHFETVSGDIDADNGGYQRLSADSVSGDIKLRGVPASNAEIDVESMSGDINLRLPEGVSAKLDASTFSGDIRSDFGAASKPDHGPGSHLELQLGSAGGEIKIETFSGDIEIRKAER